MIVFNTVIKMESNGLSDKNLKDLILNGNLYKLIDDDDSSYFLALFRVSVKEGWGHQLVDALDQVSLRHAEQRDLSKMARVLAMSAQLMDIISQTTAAEKQSFTNEDVLSKKKANVCFKQIVEIAEHPFSNWKSAIRNLMEIRNSFQDYSAVTSYYDVCVQLLIQKCVKSALSSAIYQPIGEKIDEDQWIEAKCPARIDFQGGWTDTPPICYELGGCVLNAAVEINGAKPIGARAKKVAKKPGHGLTIREFGSENKLISEVTPLTIDDFNDYKDPNASCSLVKAALIYTGIVTPENKFKYYIHQQIFSTLNSALEIEIWSNLPHGSGLGTSSILAAAIVAVLWTICGREFTRSSLIHAVIYLEQLMTTGGGWQDQIGGVVGGIKLGTSHGSLPLQISYKKMKLSYKFKSELESHLLLIYTGTVRLAKNLLKNVIRNWYLREDKIVECFNQLISNAQLCAEAFENEDLKTIGLLLSKYWAQKKILAPDCEPANVAKFLVDAESHLLGGSLTGAGGGGFLCLFLKDSRSRDQIVSLAKKHLSNCKFFDCRLDQTGIELLVDGVVKDIPE